MSSKIADWIVDKNRREIPYAGYLCEYCGHVEKRELPYGTTLEEAELISDEIREEHVAIHRREKEEEVK